ncbi:hypothetical protein GGI22_004304, partial [Coemansia erecta]
MSIALPYPQPPRLRAEPVAELSGFVACNKPDWQTAIHNTGKTQLPRNPGSQSLLHRAKDTSRLTTAAACNSSHERALEMLRTVLSSLELPSSPSDSDMGAIKHEAKSVEPQASKISAGLEVHRATFLESLYDMQDSAAESIAAINALLCNRVKLGLLDSTSAKSYYAQIAQAADGDDMLAISIDFVDESDEQHQLGDGDISSSLNSNGSSDTLAPDNTEMAVDISGDDNDEPQQQQPAQGTKARLIEMWATNGFWRGVSTRAWSSHTQQQQQQRRSSAYSGSTLAAGICDIEAEKST